MPEEKIAAFLEEFPWVSRYVSGPIKQVYVSRITPELISKKPFQGEEISLIAKNGDYIPVRRMFWSWRKIGKERTIWSALHSMEREKAPPARFILSYLYEETIYYYHKVYTGRDYPASVIVYKPPNNLNVVEWVRQQINAEKAKLQQECDVIDSEATK